ncbi:defender against cell death 1 [Jaminaea rosea]|uniref:Dolichyl-diphosphooligosaccharide--protein glycosyltransferase subunit OST2 n=1 Tax=Jaminaea rosea TaxID=1569628 RepID=A0A316UVA1_9BASI|nr:defender against cell death 1 [Jaminaea rosea]PWN29209.1 defender against cell death 1 [Jaminaea rosea]
MSRRATPSKAGGGGNQAIPSDVVSSLYSSYRQSTPLRHKIIDAFLVFNMIAGILIFAHGILVTTFPFDSWIASFASTAGQFVLLAALRIQTTQANAADFPKVTQERAFADFLFASVILHFFVLNYLQ